MSPRSCLLAGALLGGTGVILGAFGAHGIGGYLVSARGAEEPRVVAGETVAAPAYHLRNWNTAADYQFTHALALLAVGLLGVARPSASGGAAKTAGVCFAAGTVVFSGSLYALGLTGAKWLGAVAPLGGTLLIVGWFALAWVVLPVRRSSTPSGARSGTRTE